MKAPKLSATPIPDLLDSMQQVNLDVLRPWGSISAHGLAAKTFAQLAPISPGRYTPRRSPRHLSTPSSRLAFPVDVLWRSSRIFNA